jgi:hypothetical protein
MDNTIGAKHLQNPLLQSILCTYLASRIEIIGMDLFLSLYLSLIFANKLKAQLQPHLM